LLSPIERTDLMYPWLSPSINRHCLLFTSQFHREVSLIINALFLLTGCPQGIRRYLGYLGVTLSLYAPHRWRVALMGRDWAWIYFTTPNPTPVDACRDECGTPKLNFMKFGNKNAPQGLSTPFPQIDVIGAVVIVWRVRGRTIRSVLCNIVCNSCAQCDAHTYEQTNSSLGWVLSHWAHFTVLRFIFCIVYYCVLYACVGL